MRRNDKYRIPKAKALLPILGYTFVFLAVVGGIISVLGLLADYVKDVRSEPDRKIIEDVAAQYTASDDSGRSEILNELSGSGYEYCIVDLKGKVVAASNSKITCSGYDASSKSFTKDAIKEMRDDIGLDKNEENNLFAAIFGSGEKTSFLVDDIYSSSRAFASALSIASADLAHMKDDELVVTFPYWIGTAINDKSEILLVRTELSVKIKDYTYLAAGVIIAIFIAIVIFVILIIGVVRNLHANRKMRNLLFRDNIARGRNWLWYATTSQEILYKRRNANKTFAVVELVFIRYRNYVLCHSVKEAEDLLKKAVSIINKKLGPNELCAHSSSSGLPLLLQVTDEENARARIQDIISTLETISPNHKLSFRAGVCLVTPAKEKVILNQKRYIPDIDLLYNNASAAGISISDTAESGIAFFDSKLVEEEKWLDKVTVRQEQAVAAEEFLIYYQPKYDPRTNELKGAEALIRWADPEMGLIPPGRFIPIFEESGFITHIDDYMLVHVARDQRRWLNEGRKCVPVSVNVSRAHFGQYDLAEYICALIDREGCPHELLEIELTESAFFDDEKAMIDTINRLKQLGFLVSMDDFGSGYSSLNSLKNMPLDILKLDAGFFRDSEDNPRTEIVVSEAIKLAKSLNMKTVAEGVEEKATVDFLASEGCDMIQGYYYAKPMPRSEYELRIPVVNPPVQPVQPVQQIQQPVQPVQPVQPIQQVQQPVQQIQQQVQTAQPVQQIQPAPSVTVQTAPSEPVSPAPAVVPAPSIPVQATPVEPAPAANPVDGGTNG